MNAKKQPIAVQKTSGKKQEKSNNNKNTKSWWDLFPEQTNLFYVVVLPTFIRKKYFALELSKALPYIIDSLLTNEEQKKTGSWREAFTNFATHLALFLTLTI